MKSILLASLLVFSACSTISSFIHSGETNKKMAQRLRTLTYAIPLTEMKAKIVEFIAMDHESPTIIMPVQRVDPSDELQYTSADPQGKLGMQVAKDGYSYKGKVYIEEVDVDVMALLRGNEKSMQKLKSEIHTGPYNIVEDTPQKFVLIRSGWIYTGEAVGADRTKLTARELRELKHEGSSWRMQWGDLFSKKLGLYLDKGPINMEESMKSAKRDAARELSLLYFLDRPTFTAWENEAKK